MPAGAGDNETMIINDPDTLAEVEAVFRRYEKALVDNDVATLDELFWQDERAIRYGIGENLYGVSEILAFRKGRSPRGLTRDLDRTMITTFGTDFATASTLFRRASAPGKVGRQMQSWARTETGWRVVAAHVSIIDEAG
jgi:AtzH-like